MQTDTHHVQYVTLLSLLCPSCDEVMEQRTIETACAPILECSQCRLAVLPRRMKRTIEIQQR